MKKRVKLKVSFDATKDFSEAIDRLLVEFALLEYANMKDKNLKVKLVEKD